MTARRATDFDLRAALDDPSFTPRVRDVPELLALLTSAAMPAEAVERALGRVGVPAARAAAALSEGAAAPARAVLTRFVGRVAAEAGDGGLVTFLAGRLGDEDVRTRRLAAVALGKARGPEAESALASALAGEASTDVRKAMLTALGKIGGPTALAALATETEEGVLAVTRTKATLMAARTVGRSVASAFDAASDACAGTRVFLRCRSGLEPVLLEELDPELRPRLGGGPRALGGQRVELTLEGPAKRLFQARTMLGFGFPLPEVRLPEPGALATAVADALTSPEALALLTHFTAGPIRYRLAWARGGKRRATVWEVAALVARRHPELVNDPTQSPWEALVHEGEGAVLVELCPRTDDPRFTYRKGDVPAASHPTIAAALVRVVGARADDVVWDPFVGSGTELCERALAGPYRQLAGSDLEPKALEVARENLAAAGAQAILLQGDACTLLPPGPVPTLIVTNPPLGRRVQRNADLGATLERFVGHAARVLAPGGRLVWMSPFPRRTALAAGRAGLTAVLSLEVDMGGFAAGLQAFRKPGGRTS